MTKHFISVQLLATEPKNYKRNYQCTFCPPKSRERQDLEMHTIVHAVSTYLHIVGSERMKNLSQEHCLENELQMGFCKSSLPILYVQFQSEIITNIRESKSAASNAMFFLARYW